MIEIAVYSVLTCLFARPASLASCFANELNFFVQTQTKTGDSMGGAEENIFLFVPNLIGYGRVVFGIASLWYMEDQPITAMSLYWCVHAALKSMIYA